MNDTAKSLKDLLDRCVTNKEWYENVSLYSESLLLQLLAEGVERNVIAEFVRCLMRHAIENDILKAQWLIDIDEEYTQEELDGERNGWGWSEIRTSNDCVAEPVLLENERNYVHTSPNADEGLTFFSTSFIKIGNIYKKQFQHIKFTDVNDDEWLEIEKTNRKKRYAMHLEKMEKAKTAKATA